MARGGKKIVCGFDVSGKELRVQICEKTADGELIKLGERIKRKLVPGFDHITDTITEMVVDGTQDVKRIDSLEIGPAMPARFQRENGSFPDFEDGSANVQQRLSGMHLGQDCWEKNWKEALENKLSVALAEKLPKQNARVAGVTSPVYASMMNDTGVQLLALIEHARAHGVDINEWRNGKVVGIAPGTGFGASTAEIDANGTIRIRHNAHMYDAMVPINPSQEKRIRDLFSAEYDIEVKDARKYALETQGDLQPFGHYFPLEKDRRKKLYLIEENGDKYILPARFFASQDGLEHLLGVDSAVMADIGNQSKEQMNGTIKAKLELIGELLGEYFVHQDLEDLRRLGFPGAPGMPYDSDGKKIPTKAILMGGGGLRDSVGEVIQEAVKQVIAKKGSPALKAAHIYRPDARRKESGYDICMAAAERCVALHNHALQMVSK